jgi:hypothetical protein
MSLKSFFEKKIKNFTFWDFALLKLVLIILGIIVGAYIALFVKQYIWYFVAVFVIGYVVLLFRTFRK